VGSGDLSSLRSLGFFAGGGERWVIALEVEAPKLREVAGFRTFGVRPVSKFDLPYTVFCSRKVS
jgi:hypothetical protein